MWSPIYIERVFRGTNRFGTGMYHLSEKKLWSLTPVIFVQSSKFQGKKYERIPKIEYHLSCHTVLVCGHLNFTPLPQPWFSTTPTPKPLLLLRGKIYYLQPPLVHYWWQTLTQCNYGPTTRYWWIRVCDNKWNIGFIILLFVGIFISRLRNYFWMISSWRKYTCVLNRLYLVTTCNNWYWLQLMDVIMGHHIIQSCIFLWYVTAFQ